MNGWTEWRDGTTIGAFLLAALIFADRSCREQTAQNAVDEARKDQTPLVETCVTHPAARHVVVQ